jgi:hypothetical protein
MRWRAERTKEFNEWWGTLSKSERRQIIVSVEVLKEEGPNAGRPYVDSVKGSRYLNMKELRATPTIRVFFAFDRRRRAMLLIGGDKAGKTKRFYRQMISKADQIYDAHLRRIKEESPRNDR